MDGSTSATSSSRSTARTSGRSPSTRSRVRRLSTTCWVGATPRSAVSRVSSIDSQVSSSSRSRESRARQPAAEGALRSGEPLAQPDQP